MKIIIWWQVLQNFIANFIENSHRMVLVTPSASQTHGLASDFIAWKHISLICNKHLKANLILLSYNNFTICQVFVDINNFLPKFYFVLNLSSCFSKNSSSLLLQNVTWYIFRKFIWTSFYWLPLLSSNSNDWAINSV